MTTIIIPTYNESKNILVLIAQIEAELVKESIHDYEILVMDDDSPDGTADLVKNLAHPQVRVINRRGKPKGLAAAVIDGIHSAHGDIVGVMDADLSHPVTTIPKLIKAIEGGMNLAVGSRYVPGGGITNWPFKRRLSSKVACMIGGLVTPIKDSTSGFFFVRKSVIEGVHLNPLGFKIGLEIFVKARHKNKYVEVPFVFTDRREGQSKFGLYVIYCYLKQVTLLIFKK